MSEFVKIGDGVLVDIDDIKNVSIEGKPTKGWSRRKCSALGVYYKSCGSTIINFVYKETRDAEFKRVEKILLKRNAQNKEKGEVIC